MTEVHVLIHHGIKGQKWYVRRYQNEDGSLTAEGKARYGQVRREGVKNYFKNTGKKMSDRWGASSTGKKIAQILLLGPVGTVAYNALRAQDLSRGKSLAVMCLGGALGTALVTDIKANKEGKKAAEKALRG